MKYDKTLSETVKLFQEKKITGLIIVGPGENNQSVASMNGTKDDIIANLAFLMFNSPQFKDAAAAAITIANNRMMGKQIDDNLSPKN